MKDFERFLEEVQIDLVENYGDEKYHPDKLSKDLPSGYKYGSERQGKGDHKTRSMQVKGTDTDVNIGGASKGTKQSYSPSWKDGHNKAKKLLKNIDKTVGEIQKTKENKDGAGTRMKKAYDKQAQTKGNKIISDITGEGRKTNPQGKGSKAARRLK